MFKKISKKIWKQKMIMWLLMWLFNQREYKGQQLKTQN